MIKSLIMIFTSITMAAGGQLLLKSGMNQVGRITMVEVRDLGTVIKVAANPLVIGGLGLYFLSALIWLVVLSRVNLSFAYPLLGTSYIVVMLASRMLFNEPISAVRWAGAVFISLGVILITRT